jgi:hypothetical protein
MVLERTGRIDLVLEELLVRQFPFYDALYAYVQCR